MFSVIAVEKNFSSVAQCVSKSDPKRADPTLGIV